MPRARADYLQVLWDELFAASNKSTRALANCKAAKSLDFDEFFEIRYDSLLEGLRSWNCLAGSLRDNVAARRSPLLI